MTNKEIANWIREWFKKHPDCKDLAKMYEDFITTIAESINNGYGYSHVGNLTELIWNIEPLKYMSYIPNYMFWSCDCVTSLSIPNNIKGIKDRGFSFCHRLNSVIISSNITSIGEHAFTMCSGLTRVTIPYSVASIGDYAFVNCSNLKNIEYLGTMSQWNSIQVSGNWNMCSGIKQIKCTDGIIELN